MKKTTKMAGLVAGLMILAGITFTGCPQFQDIVNSFGKDDFYGYWKTIDYTTDSTGTANRVDYYSNNGSFYQIEWEFDGKSENVFKDNSNGGTFRQHLTRYSDAALTTKTNETFWTGAYKITSNSGYDKGKLFLYYEFGAQLSLSVTDANTGTVYQPVTKEDGTTKYTYDEVKNWKSEDFLNMWKHGKINVESVTGDKGLDLLADSTLQGIPAATGVSVANGVSVKVRYANAAQKKNPVCSDIEYFRFRLRDSTVSGYGRMMATTMDKTGANEIGRIYNKWLDQAWYDEHKEDTVSGTTYKIKDCGSYSSTYGCPVKKGCNWTNMNNRCLARYTISSNYTQPASSDTKTNAVLFGITTGTDGNITSISDASEDSNDNNDYTVIEQ